MIQNPDLILGSINTKKNVITDRFTPSWECYERSQSSPYSGRITDRTSQEVHKDPLSGYDVCPEDQKNKNPILCSHERYSTLDCGRVYVVVFDIKKYIMFHVSKTITIDFKHKLYF